MELLERYLQAVGKHLHTKRQEDILAELRANLEAQLEDKEAELGRPLTEAEAEAWLKQIGPPLQMASRYRPAQYLIGPAVFPTYWFVLRLALTWAVVIYAVLSAVLIATRTPDAGAVATAMVRLPGVLMSTAAWVTLAFAIVEYSAARNPAKFPAFAAAGTVWSPATLPPLERTEGPGKAGRSRAHAIAEVVAGFVVLVWLLLIPAHPILLLGPGAALFKASPYQLVSVWWPFYWWAVANHALQFGWHGLDLWRGTWHRPGPAQHIVVKALGLIPLNILLYAPDGTLVTLKHAGLAQPYNGLTLDKINYGLHVGVLVITLIVAAQLLWDLGKVGVVLWRKRAAK
jgi:hypothetical protein